LFDLRGDGAALLRRLRAGASRETEIDADADDHSARRGRRNRDFPPALSGALPLANPSHRIGIVVVSDSREMQYVSREGRINRRRGGLSRNRSVQRRRRRSAAGGFRRNEPGADSHQRLVVVGGIFVGGGKFDFGPGRLRRLDGFRPARLAQSKAVAALPAPRLSAQHRAIGNSQQPTAFRTGDVKRRHRLVGPGGHRGRRARRAAAECLRGRPLQAGIPRPQCYAAGDRMQSDPAVG
jgi:hypothetical protein